MSYTSKVIAVLGRTVRSGRWKLAEDSLVIAVFGRCSIDLTRAYVDEEDEDLSMSIFSLFGSVNVVLPPGCDIEPSGVAIMSSSEVAIPSSEPTDITRTALAPLDISFFALFSKVRVAEGGEDRVAMPGDVAAATRSVPAVETMAPPAVEVFDAGSNVVHEAPGARAADEAAAEAAEAAEAAAEQASVADAEAQAAALRDEIAQWRASSGRDAGDGDDAAGSGGANALDSAVG